jgi:OOP family OmpA-OmpF porin
MKTSNAVRAIVTISGSFLLALSAWAQESAAPSTPAAPASPAVQKVSVKGTARFDFDKAAVNEEDGLKLMKEVRSMKNVTWQTISVTGHTDSIGPEPYNVKLSEKRAHAVQEFLIGKGVKPERIKTDAKGPREPIASNKTKEGRAQNRRTEIEFVGLQSVAQN